MRRALAFLAVCSLLVSCVTVWAARFVKPGITPVDANAPFLKVHTEAGEVYVLTGWEVDTASRVISGTGRHYDASRALLQEASFKIAFDAVALLETNTPTQVLQGQFVVLGVVTGASLLASAVCVATPKTCFGSCPTFYVRGDAQPRAEGFSRAIARGLEETDLDALEHLHEGGGVFELLMRNEALETHAVRRLRVLAAKAPPSGRVLRQGERYFAATSLEPPLRCEAASGDCLERVRSVGAGEYFSLSDADDVTTRETVSLTFPRSSGALGLTVRARASLMSTYLLYQAMAWMGTDASDWYARLEHGDRRGADAFERVVGLLGDLEVQVKTVRGWVTAGAFAEAGPLAADRQLVTLPADLPEGPVEVRLVMTQGHWRVDQVALAALSGEVQPVPVELSAVTQKGQPAPDALARLHGEGPRLISNRGDEWALQFPMPEGRYELFLEARGYYYEWVRPEWLAEQSPDAMARLLVDPEATLKSLSPAWKRAEPQMEAMFWGSRFTGPVSP
jgi:hypothetical protein